ncbi:MAG: DUF308 domain-containing protein, partial [Eubacterium sp.]|nr:DUF308 domain-containing protein [Eubacterium sp.]
MADKSLKNFFKTETKSLAVPLLMVVIGALFIILRDGILSALVTIVGVLLIVGGVIIGFSLFSNLDPFAIIGAALLVMFGIICVTNAFGVSNFVLTVLGVCILVNSLVRIFVERSMKGSAGFKGYMINDILTAILGVILIMVPRDAAAAVFLVLGIFMVILGISNIIAAYSYYKNGRFVN